MPPTATHDPVSLLPSWRPSPVRDDVVSFLNASADIPPPQRVAVFDNDGTLWCEKPAYFQMAFFLAELRAAVADDPAVGQRPEYRALLGQDQAALADFGLPRIAAALAELCSGLTPEEFSERSARFLLEHQHPVLGRPFGSAVYQPMLELLEALRAHGFATFIVSGGGTEFVRAVSEQLYGVPPEGVVGTFIEYEYAVRDGAPVLRRTARIFGDANEGPTKVVNIQQHLGRRPVFAAGNSAGDREMIEWAVASGAPSLGMLIHHDDGDREFAYDSIPGTFAAAERIVDVAVGAGWTVVSMRDHWATVFPPPAGRHPNRGL